MCSRIETRQTAAPAAAAEAVQDKGEAREVPAKFHADTSGATALEYALIALFVALAVIAGATSIGSSLAGFFGNLATGFGG
jgi:pilus assembly protein Flp/PilA